MAQKGIIKERKSVLKKQQLEEYGSFLLKQGVPKDKEDKELEWVRAR